VTEDICLLPLAEVGRRYRARKLSPVEVVDALLERIGRLDPVLNTYVTVLEGDLRTQAKEAERRLSQGDDAPPLLGIPVSIKDNIATEGVRTTAGSRILADWVPDRDAECVRRLREAGALVAGKTNLFEFAFGEAHDDYGHVRNPWSLERSTAGSSTGAAAAVAAGLCFAGLATDTGGSIRVPAAFCGAAGLKPTYGRVPSDGIVSTSWTMCHVGPIARTVEDAAIVFGALAGDDRRPRPPSLVDLRLAVAVEPDGDGIDPEVRAATEAARAAFEAEGARVEEVELPLLLARDLLWAIASPEAADIHHGRLSTRADDFHPVVRARLERGRSISAEIYVRAQRVRRWLAGRLDALLADADALLLPVAPILPYALGARTVLVDGREEEVSQAVTRYTPLASVTGRPALAVPCGFSAEGLPIGVQLVGHPGRDEELLAVGSAFERIGGRQARHPDLAAATLAGSGA
jgi:aspartyl-tRNA(Asn)/glutamyl-tRNA(Gln) amidotransferase subunit A